MNYQEIKKNIHEIEFKEGNSRSLAMSLSSCVGIAEAWEFAKEVAEKYGKNFEKKDVIEYLDLKEGKASSHKVDAKNNTQINSLNSKIRQFLSEGKTVSEISKLLSISYQRVKNVQKREANKISVAKEKQSNNQELV